MVQQNVSMKMLHNIHVQPMPFIIRVDISTPDSDEF